MLSFPTFTFEDTVEVDNNQGYCCQVTLTDRLPGLAPSPSENIDALTYVFIYPTAIPEEILCARHYPRCWLARQITFSSLERLTSRGQIRKIR